MFHIPQFVFFFFSVFIECVTTLLLFFMFWFFSHKTCRTLAPQPGIQPEPPVLKGEVSTTGPPGKPPHITLCNKKQWIKRQACYGNSIAKKWKMKKKRKCPGCLMSQERIRNLLKSRGEAFHTP